MLLVAASALLVGCEIVVTGGGTPYDGVVIRDAAYRTNATARIDGVDRFVICDDRVTDLSYSFDYRGPLEAWTSYLYGVHTHDTIGRQTFRPSDAGVHYDPHHVSVTYGIHPGMAPLAVDSGHAAAPQGIVVVPVPKVIGYTRLYLEVGRSAPRQLVSKDIPVVASCST